MQSGADLLPLPITFPANGTAMYGARLEECLLFILTL